MTEHLPGKVFIASMNMRGEWAQPLDPNTVKLNVTSAQGKTSKNRRDFSPMTEIEGGYNGFWNFESYWQSGKVFESVPYEKTREWWLKLKEPKRRYPNSKGKKILCAKWVEFPDETMDYVTSRKKVYIPLYWDLVKDREMIAYYRELLLSGKNITVYDFDGVRDDNGRPICRELTRELLREKVNDVRFPFGHGFIVGALISGISFEEFI